MQGKRTMDGISMSKQALRAAVSGTMAIALLAGCAGQGKFAAKAGSAAPAARQSAGKDTRTIAKAEEQVARQPRDAALRVALGRVYLDAGRFDSAATAFNDAMTLGDQSGRTALSLALAEVGAGNGKEAVAILDDWRDAIPAEDLGLALALAGETGRGVAILGDALRGGADNPKVRQNLAYAYALDGRWAEARLMAAQDLPADKLDARISDWAMSGRAEDYARRVATLLGTTVADDPGQPAHLALANDAGEKRLTVAAPVSVAEAELPPAAAVATIAPAPVPAPIPAEVFAASPAPAVTPLAPASAQSFAAAFTSTPVVQAVPVHAVQPARSKLVSARQAHPVAPRAAAASGTHLVQLGSFASAQGARRAWGVFAARHQELRGSQPVITQAVVNGKNFWRVAASGFSAGSARSLCSTVKNRGGVCFAYAGTVPAGATPGGSSGPVRARR